MYIVKFDNNGKCEQIFDDTMFPEVKAKMLNEGYVEIDEEERSYYIGEKGEGENGTGYIRVNGKPVSAPAYVPSKEEQIAQLDSDYKANQALLKDYFVQAIMNNDKEIMEEIQTELQDLKAEYDAEINRIEGE